MNHRIMLDDHMAAILKSTVTIQKLQLELNQELEHFATLTGTTRPVPVQVVAKPPKRRMRAAARNHRELDTKVLDTIKSFKKPVSALRIVETLPGLGRSLLYARLNVLLRRRKITAKKERQGQVTVRMFSPA